MHPEHNPPSHMVYTDGVYEHTCPSCGHVQTFTVLNPSLRWSSGGYHLRQDVEPDDELETAAAANGARRADGDCIARIAPARSDRDRAGAVRDLHVTWMPGWRTMIAWCW